MAESQHSGKGDGPYWKFMAMIGTSTAVMLFLMYLNTYSIDHVFWSETRFWMAFVMGGALWLVRSQTTVTGVEYMRAMIPHHSIAIMTSERAHIRDPRVRKLAHDIIVAQRREIAQMKYLIADIEKNGVRSTKRLPQEVQP